MKKTKPTTDTAVAPQTHTIHMSLARLLPYSSV